MDWELYMKKSIPSNYIVQADVIDNPQYQRDKEVFVKDIIIKLDLQNISAAEKDRLLKLFLIGKYRVIPV